MASLGDITKIGKPLAPKPSASPTITTPQEEEPIESFGISRSQSFSSLSLDKQKITPPQEDCQCTVRVTGVGGLFRKAKPVSHTFFSPEEAQRIQEKARRDQEICLARDRDEKQRMLRRERERHRSWETIAALAGFQPTEDSIPGLQDLVVSDLKKAASFTTLTISEDSNQKYGSLLSILPEGEAVPVTYLPNPTRIKKFREETVRGLRKAAKLTRRAEQAIEKDVIERYSKSAPVLKRLNDDMDAAMSQ